MRSVLVLAILALMLTPACADASAPSQASGTESLGNQLLDDLAPFIPPKHAATSNNEKHPESSRSSSPAPATPHFEDLGEDIGQPNGPLPLVRAQQGMRRATTLLEESTKTADARAIQQTGTVQKQVVAQLDELIAELSKQCQGGQCQPSDQPPQPSQRSQPNPGESSKSTGRGTTSARDSSDRLNQRNAEAIDKGDIDELVKDLWGHLPERSREQMLQSFSDEFLPKYELEIEQYYRRLSEQQE
jgi:hypothetical protein